MFFKKDNKESAPAASLAKITSFVTRDSTFKGNIVTNDSVEISGEFIGDIDCKKDVVINEFGSVSGNIIADKVTTQGKISGKVMCETFLGEKKSFTTDYVEAKDVVISGVFEGIIRCDNLDVRDGGHAKNREDSQSVVQATNIEVAGKIEGDIACETLSTSMQGNIKGKLFVNKLLNNGGTIDGFIGKFQKILEDDSEQADDENLSNESSKKDNQTEEELLTTN